MSDVPLAAAYTIAVRALCEFAAKRGDLDLRFTPAPSSQEGIAGHKTVAARRSAAYRAEVPLSGEFRHLVVRGRADGYDPERRLVEEIKTFRGDLERMPSNHRELHWAQVKVYGWLLCREHALSSLTVSLVYFDVGRQTETSFEQHCTAHELQHFFEALCEGFIAWAERELAHRAARDAALAALRFPHAAFRTGQRALAASVFKAARLGRCLMAQAPTGIGKTVGTIFPLLKACPSERLDKIFFLCAKGPGRGVALQAIATIRAQAPALPLRVLELVARDKACEHPDKACHGDACPLARGFYDRLPRARDAAVANDGVLDKDTLREIALAHGVCPYHLGHELARWADVIVGDYNHFFDSTALLYGLTTLNPWRVAVLVDEAHNLVERARQMYSAELRQSNLRALRAAPPVPLKKPLDRLHKAWNALAKAQNEPYGVLEHVPRTFAAALQDTTAAISEHCIDHPDVDRALLEFYFEALRFSRLIDSFGPHSLFDVTRGAGRRAESSLCVRNVVPASFLQPRFAAAHATVLFSATLTPARFYSDTLGLPDDTAWLDVDAPFSAEQLSVRIVRHVSTRYRHRGDSLAPIATLMAAQYEAAPGNYLAFFSSFDYLQRAAETFAERHPAIPIWLQQRQMDERQRDAFLQRFEPDGRGIAFAVLGGSFAEGIDLPGSRLVGAFIATLGLPQFNPINEEMRRRIDATFGTGYDYAYLFPGIRKVVQAAGRVIRTPSDRGSIHLIDDRFARPEVRRLLPAWWRIEA